MTVNERKFYFPKLVLTGGIWVCLVLTLGFISLKEANDPSFSWKEDIESSFFSALQMLFIILIGLYASYFVLVAYVSFFQANTFRDMKHSYKISLLLTFGVIAACITLLIANAYTTHQHEGLLKYVSFTALLNLYIWLVAYLYSPAVDSLEDIQFKQARKEHEHIMNQFYEQELPDISRNNETMQTQEEVKATPSGT
jgi:heme/copper-type cytochrome/quinol oxidase subunit 2